MWLYFSQTKSIIRKYHPWWMLVDSSNIMHYMQGSGVLIQIKETFIHMWAILLYWWIHNYVQEKSRSNAGQKHTWGGITSAL